MNSRLKSTLRLVGWHLALDVIYLCLLTGYRIPTVVCAHGFLRFCNISIYVHVFSEETFIGPPELSRPNSSEPVQRHGADFGKCSRFPPLIDRLSKVHRLYHPLQTLFSRTVTPSRLCSTPYTPARQRRRIRLLQQVTDRTTINHLALRTHLDPPTSRIGRCLLAPLKKRAPQLIRLRLNKPQQPQCHSPILPRIMDRSRESEARLSPHRNMERKGQRQRQQHQTLQPRLPPPKTIQKPRQPRHRHLLAHQTRRLARRPNSLLNPRHLRPMQPQLRPSITPKMQPMHPHIRGARISHSYASHARR